MSNWVANFDIEWIPTLYPAPAPTFPAPTPRPYWDEATTGSSPPPTSEYHSHAHENDAHHHEAEPGESLFSSTEGMATVGGSEDDDDPLVWVYQINVLKVISHRA